MGSSRAGLGRREYPRLSRGVMCRSKPRMVFRPDHAARLQQVHRSGQRHRHRHRQGRATAQHDRPGPRAGGQKPSGTHRTDPAIISAVPALLHQPGARLSALRGKAHWSPRLEGLGFTARRLADAGCSVAICRRQGSSTGAWGNLARTEQPSWRNPPNRDQLRWALVRALTPKAIRPIGPFSWSTPGTGTAV